MRAAECRVTQALTRCPDLAHLLLCLLSLIAGRPARDSARPEEAMDFVERLFGFSPDGGSGAFELILLLVPVAVLGVALVLRCRWRARPGGE